MNRDVTLVTAGTLFVVAALLLGGSASQGLIGAAALQLAAVAIIAWSIATPEQVPTGWPRGLALIAGAALLVAFVQSVPLPPALWQALPGRAVLTRSLALVHADDRWHPISLAPAATLAAALALLPAIAGGLLGLRVSRTGLRAIGWGVAATLLVSIVLGLGQRSGGADSGLYLYAVTNRTEAVGLFANSNHFGSFCAVTIPLLTALFVARRGATKPSQRWIGLAVLLLVALGGAVLSRSLAAIGLAVPALAAVYAIARLKRSRAPLGRGTMLALLSGGAAVVVVAGVLAWLDLDDAGSTGGMDRASLWVTASGATLRLLPFGGGLGSFPSVYPAFENPQGVTEIFANHAHNDLIELPMDVGVLGAALIVAFLIWWTRTALAIVRAPERDAWREAAVAVTGLLLLHELVDYPLRTPALSVLFGLCCGIMARGVIPRLIEEQPVREGRHLEA